MLNLVTHWNTQASMLASIICTLDWFTFLPSDCTRSISSHICWAFVTSVLARIRLIKVTWARRAWCQASWGIESRSAFRTTSNKTQLNKHVIISIKTVKFCIIKQVHIPISSWSSWLIRERASGASLTIFVTSSGWFTSVTISRAFQARN